MVSNPLISVIMPCNRPDDLPRAIEVFLSQDWENKELLICVDYGMAIPIPTGYDHLYSNSRKTHYWNSDHPVDSIYGDIIEIPYSGTIGAKRNKCCNCATGDIIAHFDSDDHYAPDYLSRTYAHLIEYKADCTGLSSAYFYRPKAEVWLYKYQGHQPYCIGSGMMYYKRVWENNHFKDLSEGEDAKFCANAGRVKPHNYIDGFLAMIHGKNTASHKQLSHMKRVDPQIAKRILVEDWDKY